MNMIKKCKYVVLLLAILLMILVTPALAGESNFIECDSDSGKPGDSVTLFLDMPDANGLAGVQFTVTYDGRYFEVEESDGDDDGLPDCISIDNSGFDMNAATVFNQKGRINFAMLRGSAEPFEDIGTIQIATIEFTIKDNCPNGTYPIKIVNCLGDGGGVVVNLGAPQNGTIKVEGAEENKPEPPTTIPNNPPVVKPPVDPVKPTLPTVPPVQPQQTNPVQVENPVLLNDISGHWAEADIKMLASKQIMTGYPDNTFQPEKPISRAEFAKILVGAFNYTPANGKVFADTSSHWAKDVIATAQYYGIINGMSDTAFAPDAPITREQMSVMVVKAAKLQSSGNPKVFADATQIASWSIEAVNIISSNGIMAGYPDNTFNPRGNATRAEAATVLLKAMEVAGVQ